MRDHHAALLHDVRCTGVHHSLDLDPKFPGAQEFGTEMFERGALMPAGAISMPESVTGRLFAPLILNGDHISEFVARAGDGLAARKRIERRRKL